MIVVCYSVFTFLSSSACGLHIYQISSKSNHPCTVMASYRFYFQFAIWSYASLWHVAFHNSTKFCWHV